MVHQMLRFVLMAKILNWFLFILMMSRGPPGKKKRAHWSSVICRSVLRLRSLMKLARRRIPRWKGFISQAMRFALSVKPKVSAILRIILTARTYWRVLPPKLLPIKPNIPSCFPTVTALRKANWKTDVTGYSGRTRSRNRATCLRWLQATSTCCATPSPRVLVAKWRWSCTSIAATSTARRGR